MAQREAPVDYVRHPGDVLRVVIGLLLLVGCCLIASTESVSAFELGVFQVVNGLPSWLYGLLWSVMQLGSLAAVFVVAGIALIARRVRMAVELLAGGLLAYYCASGLKDIIGRGRPAEMVTDVVFHGDPSQGLGFPSGHAAVSAALAAVAVPFLARRWRRWVWALPVTVGFARIFVGAHLPLDVVGGFLLGWTIGAAVHLALGAPSGRVTADQVSTALQRAGLLVAEVHPANVDARGSTPFFATGVDGTRWFAKAVGADQRDGDILFKAYRRIMFRDLDDEKAFASPKRQIEAEALVDLLAARAGVRTPQVAAITTLEDGTTLLAHQALDATGLERAAPEDLTDDLLTGLWELVALLHAARIAHRDLRLANMMIDSAGLPWLLDFGFSQVSATDRLLSRDVAELLASQSTVIAPQRAAAAAVGVLGVDPVRSALPYLAVAGLSGATRAAFAAMPGRFEELRRAAAGAVGVSPPEPVRFTRLNPRLLIGLIAVGAALYALPLILAAPAVTTTLRDADWWLLVPTVIAFAAGFLGAAAVVQGAVDHPVAWSRAALIAVASVSPGRSRAAALRRSPVDAGELRAAGVDTAAAEHSVRIASTAGWVAHLLALLVVAVAVMVAPDAGGGFLSSVVGVITVVVVVVAALMLAWIVGGDGGPAARARAARAAWRERDAGEGRTVRLWIGSIIVVVGWTLTFAGATLTVVPHTAALGAALVYLAAVPVAALLPVPGSVLVLDAALLGGLLLDGVDPVPAIVAVLLFRAVTFWLVLPAGAWAHRRLSREQALQRVPGTAGFPGAATAGR
ncbi:MAG TPA: phosphatase PAP2 family protein [Mycobacterium sp.]